MTRGVLAAEGRAYPKMETGLNETANRINASATLKRMGHERDGQAVFVRNWPEASPDATQRYVRS
jgi:hypothetical protein